MKLLTKIATLGCGFSGISALSATYAYICSDKPTPTNLTKMQENKKTNGLFGGNKEYDFNNYSNVVLGEQDTWL